MKLIYIIVSSDDDDRVMEQLNKKGFSGTKMATTGGFLRSGNTTLIVGTEEEKVGTVIDIVKKECGPRQRITANTPPVGSANQGFEAYPVMVDVGGATIFVVNVEQYVKI
ncbi:MAG: transcriptional regulator [Lachnospiraceae bacterium]|nr:transcriptional regulator [Lachnospiraceae bacterium]